VPVGGDTLDRVTGEGEIEFDGWTFYTGGGLQGGYIGTSFASPIFAGCLAIIEQDIISLGGLPPNGAGKRRFGRIQDLFYSMNGRPDIWHDITSGANGTLPDGSASTCHAGWDSVTGWGPMDCGSFAAVAACLTGGCGPGTAYCAGDSGDPFVTTFCPCFNFGALGHGCANSADANGAILTATGTANPDNVVFSSSGELPSALSIVLQGTSNVATGLVFGDGVRCVTGILKRIGIKNAVAGTAVYPGPGDPSITSRSAALGDPIAPGSTRYYQSYYRDPLAIFCPPLTFNSSNGIIVQW